MRRVTTECVGLQNPTSIRSSKLRTYLGTTAQIMDMTGAELKILADHMGHSFDIHMYVYRLQSAILECSNVSRVLLVMDNGTIHNFRGNSLDDIRETGRRKTPWTEKEDRAFKEAFGKRLIEKVNMSADEIRKAQIRFPVLQNRSLPLIGTKLNNIITGKV